MGRYVSYSIVNEIVTVETKMGGTAYITATISGNKLIIKNTNTYNIIGGYIIYEW